MATTLSFRIGCKNESRIYDSFTANRVDESVVIKVVAATKLLELFNRNNFSFPGTFLNVATTVLFRIGCRNESRIYASFTANRVDESVVIKVVAATKLLELFSRNNFNFPGTNTHAAATLPLRVLHTPTLLTDPLLRPGLTTRR